MKRLMILAIALLASSTIALAQEGAQTTTNTPQQSIQEQSSEPKTEKPTKKRNNYFRRGYFGIVDGSVAAYILGGLVGGIDIINGHNSDWFGIGIGVGCRAGMGKEVAIPIYVHLRASTDELPQLFWPISDIHTVLERNQNTMKQCVTHRHQWSAQTFLQKQVSASVSESARRG